MVGLPQGLPRCRTSVQLGILILALVLLVSPPAFAEVCDKAVGDTWTRDHGPVWILNPLGFPIGWVLFGTLVAAALYWRWPYVLVAGAALHALPPLMYLLLSLLNVMPDDDGMHEYMLLEGCTSIATENADMIIHLLISSGLSLIAYLQLKKKRHVQI